MAERLKTFEFKSSGGSSRDWSQWTDGSPWKLTQGTDYSCKTNTMATQARSWAKRNGFSVRISVQGEDSLVLEFSKSDGQAPDASGKPAKGSTRRPGRKSN